MPEHREGAIAQLGERLLCKQEVVGSTPSGSTNFGVVPAGDLIEAIGFKRLGSWTGE